MKVFGILLAAGLSVRFESDKLFALYKDKELIRYPVETFLNCDDIDPIVIVCNETNIEKTKEILNSYAIDKKFELKPIVNGELANEYELDSIKSISDNTNLNILLKGANTIITTPNGIQKINTLANGGMSKPGMGDVLTWTIGSLDSNNSIHKPVCS